MMNFNLRAKKYVASRKTMRAAVVNSYAGVKVIVLETVFYLVSIIIESGLTFFSTCRESPSRRLRFPPSSGTRMS